MSDSDENEFNDPQNPNRKLRYSDMMNPEELASNRAMSRNLGYNEEQAEQRAREASMEQMRSKADIRAAQAAKAASGGGDAGGDGGSDSGAPWKSSGDLNDGQGEDPWKKSGDLNDGAGSPEFPNTRAGREAANALRSAENVFNEYDDKMRGKGGRPLSNDELAQREKEAQAWEDYKHGHGPMPRPRTQPESAQLGKGYNPNNQGDDGKKPGRLRRAGRKIRSGMKNRRRAAIAGAAFSALGVVGGIAFMSLLPFQLHHIMQNIDAHTFARLQGVDVEGRSSKWIQAYMLARLMDIEDAKGNAKPDENILFRAKRVDNNKPWKDWYKTTRTTNFEQDVFKKHGITFSSIAKREGNQIIVRPAKVMVKNKAVFEYNIRAAGFTADELKRGLAGDIEVLEKFDRMTGQLKSLIRVEVFDGDKSARKEVKKVVKEMVKVNNIRSWNAIKRYHVRKDIQNMTGIRDWTFFEKTRAKWKEKKISARNKLLAKALPANLKSGKFLRCMFGIDTCRVSTDPYSPDNRNLPVNGRNAGSDRTDSSGNPIGTGEASLEPGIKPDAELSDLSKKISRQLIKAGGLAASIVPLVSSLAIFDENVNNHAFSGAVEVARSQQMIDFAAQLSIASSQLNTSEVVGDEVDDFMGIFANITNTEGWETIVNERPNTVLAATNDFVPASNKKEYCSEEHQAVLDKPENYKYAANEFAHHCPADQIGAVTRAALFEDDWNNGLGKILHPVLEVWRNTIGAIEDIFNAIVDAVLGPVMEAVLSALGLDKKIEEFMGWVGEKVLAFSGAGPMWNERNIERKAGNFAFQGRAATAEASARGQGAALTTPQMKQDTEDAYFSSMREKWQDKSFSERYLSLDEPDSMASNALFALVNRSPSSIGRSIVSSMGSLFSIPLNFLSKTVHAADQDAGSPYIAARDFAGIPTFDFPKDRCLDRDVIGVTPKPIRTAFDGTPIYGDGASGDGLKESMTPQNATNAVELGVMKAEDLNWDLLQDKDRWYAALYEWADDDEEDLETVKKVWNCALLDNAVAGGLGGLYGYQGVGALSSSKTILKNEE
jgi:hypothetical protein